MALAGLETWAHFVRRDGLCASSEAIQAMDGEFAVSPAFALARSHFVDYFPPGCVTSRHDRTTQTI
jgi:hypothetical protein